MNLRALDGLFGEPADEDAAEVLARPWSASRREVDRVLAFSKGQLAAAWHRVTTAEGQTSPRARRNTANLLRLTCDAMVGRFALEQEGDRGELEPASASSQQEVQQRLDRPPEAPRARR